MKDKINRSGAFFRIVLPVLFYLLIQFFMLKTPLVSGHEGFITGEAFRIAWNNLNFFNITRGLNVINLTNHGHTFGFYYSFPLFLNWFTTIVSYIFGLSVYNLRACAALLSSLSFLGLYLFAMTLPSKGKYACWLALGIAPLLYYGTMPEEFTAGNGFVLITCALLLPYYKFKLSCATIAIFSFLSSFTNYSNVAVFFFFVLFLIANQLLSGKIGSGKNLIIRKIRFLVIGSASSLLLSILYSLFIVKNLSPLYKMYQAFLYRTYTVFHISYSQLFNRIINDIYNYYLNVITIASLLIPAYLLARDVDRKPLKSALQFTLSAFIPIIILKQMTYFHNFSYLLTVLGLCLVGELTINLIKERGKRILNYFIAILLGVYFAWGMTVTLNEIQRRLRADNINAFLQMLDYDDFVIYPRTIGRSTLHIQNPSNMAYFNDLTNKESIAPLLKTAANDYEYKRIFVVLNKKDSTNRSLIEKDTDYKLALEMNKTLIFLRISH